MNAAVQLTQSTQALTVMTLGLGALAFMLLGGGLQLTDRFNSLEAIMRRPISFGLIGIAAGALMAAGAVNLPLRIRSLLARPEVRFLAIALAGFAGSGDVETAVIGTLFFLSILQLLRTPEERRQTPYMV